MITLLCPLEPSLSRSPSAKRLCSNESWDFCRTEMSSGGTGSCRTHGCVCANEIKTQTRASQGKYLIVCSLDQLQVYVCNYLYSLYLVLLHHALDLVADFACVVGHSEMGIFAEFVPAEVGIIRQLLLQTHAKLLRIRCSVQTTLLKDRQTKRADKELEGQEEKVIFFRFLSLR